MNRCTFTWISTAYGPVRCWHSEESHPNRHEAWPSRKARRRFPKQMSWVAVGSEDHMAEQVEAVERVGSGWKDFTGTDVT